MTKIFLTGSSGFLGTNFINYFNDIYTVKKYDHDRSLVISSDVVINFAGKAHDTLNSSHENEYYAVNTLFSNKLFDAFLLSNAKVFITISSVKAVADFVFGELTENVAPNPITHYGKSKLEAEKYILPYISNTNKRIYILRPCMIHGPGNKGNLTLLYNLVMKGLPWPLGAFANKRSFCSIDNLMFILKELIERDDIPSGVYNVADDLPVSTNEIINMIAESKGKKANILNISMNLIKVLARFGDFIKLPLNSERLKKLTESYVVSNSKIKAALGKPLPVSSKNGLIRTVQSFAHNV